MILFKHFYIFIFRVGIKAGVPTYIPPACRVIPDGCEPVVVLRSDNVTDCYAGQAVGFTSQNSMMTINMMKRLTTPQAGTRGGMTEEAMDRLMRYMMLAPLLSSMGLPASAPTSASGPTVPQYGSPLPGFGNNMFGKALLMKMMLGGEM